MSLWQNGFRNLAKLAFWSHSVQVKDRKAPSDPLWPRFCCLRCFFEKNLPKNFFFLKIVLFWNVLKKTDVNNVCFNSRKVTFSTAEMQKLHLSLMKKALWNNARAGQDYPHAANNGKFHLWRWEENMYTIFCYDTAFDLIMPTSRSSENLQRGYQLNSSFSKFLYYTHVLRSLFAWIQTPSPGILTAVLRYYCWK